jgi:hypothetical protein
VLRHPSQEYAVRQPSYARATPEILVLTVLRSLAAVNFFLAIVGIVQLTRIGMYQSSQKSAGEIVEGMKEDVKETVAEAKTEVKEAVKN